MSLYLKTKKVRTKGTGYEPEASTGPRGGGHMTILGLQEKGIRRRGQRERIKHFAREENVKQ